MTAISDTQLQTNYKGLIDAVSAPKFPARVHRTRLETDQYRPADACAHPKLQTRSTQSDAKLCMLRSNSFPTFYGIAFRKSLNLPSHMAGNRVGAVPSPAKPASWHPRHMCKANDSRPRFFLVVDHRLITPSFPAPSFSQITVHANRRYLTSN